MGAAINVGGAGTYFDDIYYQPDVYGTGGQTNSTADTIINAAGSRVFNSERYGDTQYRIPVDNGAYSVALHFAEMYWSASGERAFDVSLEGATVITDLDVFEEVGHDAAYSQRFDVRVTDGFLNIALTTVTDNATLSGILVRKNPAASSSAPASASSQSSVLSSAASSICVAASSSAPSGQQSSASSAASTPVGLGALNITELLAGLIMLLGAMLLRPKSEPEGSPP